MAHIVSMRRTTRGLVVLYSDGVCEVKEGNVTTGFHTQFGGDHGRVACSANGNVIAVSNNESCRLTLWKRSPIDATVFTSTLLEKGDDRYDSAVFNPSNCQMAAVIGKDVITFDVGSEKLISRPQTGEQDYLHAVTFIGDASLLFGGESGTLYAYTVIGNKVTPVHTFNTPITAITVAGNAILVFLADGRACKFNKPWKSNTATLEYTDRLSDFNDVLLQYGVSPDGKLLAVGCQEDYTVMVYSVATMAVVTSLSLPSKGLSAMVFDDNRTLLCAVKNDVVLYKLEGTANV